jgi:predicted RNA-binding protein with PIN domain
LPRKAVFPVLAALEDDEFRARVAAKAEESALGRASFLAIVRPPGWEAELSEIIEEHADADSGVAPRDLERVRKRLVTAESTIAQLRTELVAMTVARDRSHSDALALAEGLAAAEMDNERLGNERTRAVRELKATEQRLAERVAEVKALTARLEAVDPTARPVAAPVDHSVSLRAVEAFSEMVERLDELSGACDLLVAQWRERLTETPGDSDEPGDGALNANAGGGTSGRPSRRVALRPQRGIDEQSPAALDWLFAYPGVEALVDGYNVAIGQWPSLRTEQQRESLLSLLLVVQRRFGTRITAVFDGDSQGGRAVRAVGSELRVVYTAAAVEADDEILAMIDLLPTEVPVVVVTDDQRVQRGVKSRGGNVVGSSRFLRWVLQ